LPSWRFLDLPADGQESDAKEPLLAAMTEAAATWGSHVESRTSKRMPREPTPRHATQRGGVGGAATGQSRRLGGAPFGIPSLEASDVEVKGSSAGHPGVRLRHQLIYGNSRIAGVARFAGAWTTPDPSDAVMRQAPVPDLALDEKTERFLVHSGLAGSSGREHTPNSPGSRPPTASTREARVQARQSVARERAPVRLR
jgi:hypothetical protein